MTKARDLANSAAAFAAVSTTELGYLDGVTSAIQTQLDAKQAVVANVSDVEIGYLDGVTSAVQTQINATIPKSLVTTAGDIIYRNATVPARLGIGTAGQVLAVNSGATAPEWATAASGGMTLLSTTTLSGTSTSVSVTATGYKNLVAYLYGAGTGSSNYNYGMTVNGVTANYVYKNTSAVSGGTILNTAGSFSSIEFNQIGNISCFGANTLNAFNVTIWDCNSSFKKLVSVNGSYINMNGTNLVMTNDVVATDATSAITNITVIANTALNSGTIQIYGVK